MSKIIRENENVGERIVEFCREMADADLVEISKDDSVSFICKATKRVAFDIHMCGGIIFNAKELTVVTDGNTGEYDYLFLDKTGIDLKRIEINNNNNLSLEMIGI